MDSSSEEVGSVEDTILALLDFLVDPLLPSKNSSSSRELLFPSQEELVAKQVHAVVLLYNYYHRRQHPDLDFMEFESFCKMAVVLKPSLLPYLNLMQKADCTEEDDLDIKISLTEKVILNCCHMCKCLDASHNNPVIEDWPVSKVAVFLVDSKKENCYLFHSSITQGVWSLIEKDVDDSTQSSEAVTKMKTGNRMKIVPKRAHKKNQKENEASFQQIAWLAIKEACGINQGDLRTLESHVVYSISKEKTAVWLYIMQCTQTNEDVNFVPIDDVIKSMRGPLVMKGSDCWITTSVVEHFHLLPFVDKVSEWLSREGHLDTSQQFKVAKEDTNCKSSHQVEPLLKTSQCSEVVKEIEKSKQLQNTSHHFETVKEVDKSSQLEVETVPNTSQCSEAVKEVGNYSCSHLETKPPQNTLNQFDTVKEIENLEGENYTNSHIKVEALPNSSHHFEAVKIVENDIISNSNDEKLLDTLQPSAVETEARNRNSNHSNEEPAQYSSQRSEAAEVKHNSSSPRKAECTKTVVYKRNRCQNKCNSKSSGVKTSNATVGSPRRQDEKHAVTGSSTNMNIDESLIACSSVDGKSNLFPCKDIDTQKQMILAEEKDQTALTGGAIVVAEVIDKLQNSDEHSVQKVISDNKISENAMSDQVETSFDSNFEHPSPVQLTVDSKETLLSQIFRKREILSQQYRCVADDLALCESRIQTILRGGEENFAVKIDSVIEGCNDICLRSVTTAEDRNRRFLDHEFPQCVKRKRLSEATLFVHSPCQELDDICNGNGWRLPTYYESPAEGGFWASVTMKGIDFECSCEGAICDNPREARNSAALNMLVKVRSMAAES